MNVKYQVIGRGYEKAPTRNDLLMLLDQDCWREISGLPDELASSTLVKFIAEIVYVEDDSCSLLAADESGLDVGAYGMGCPEDFFLALDIDGYGPDFYFVKSDFELKVSISSLEKAAHLFNKGA